MKSYISVILCLVMHTVVAQTYQIPSESPDSTTYKEVKEHISVLIIPFEPKLYHSEIDKKLAKELQLSYADINLNMRIGMANAMQASAMNKYPALHLLQPKNPEMMADLRYTYQSVGYEFVEIPQEEKAAKDISEKLLTKVKNTFNTSAEQESNGISEGQINKTISYKNKFMKTRVFNPSVIPYLADKYGVKYFIFLNELDIREAAPGTDYRYLEDETYKRQIKLHYSILDDKGNEVYSNAAYDYFSSKVNDIEKIVKQHFTKLADMVASHLPVETPIEDKQEQINRQKAEKQREKIDATYDYEE